MSKNFELSFKLWRPNFVFNTFASRPTRLKKLALRVLSHEDCQTRWTTENFTMPISPAMICAKSDDPKSSGCLGDSGGKDQGPIL